jgi:membrane-associated phospholipid phosphatase
MERLTILDLALSQRLTLPSESTWRHVARFVAHIGDGQYVFSALGVIYLLGWFWGEPLLRRGAATVTLVVLAAMIVVTLIKFMVRRQRPCPPGEFVTFQYDLYSFPSGHAVRLAALAVSAAFFYPPLGWLLGGIALGVAAARVAVGIHYVSDIMIGLSIGALVAWGATSFLFPLLAVLSWNS